MLVNFISILRFLAVLLVINSHCGIFYPSSLSELGTGGALANAIFFFCSGFTLCLSNNDIGFTKWMIRRLIRIYPSVWVFLLLCNLFVGEGYHIKDFFITPFWFVNAILLFYIPFYYIIKYIPKRIPFIIGILLVPYLVTYFFFNDYSVFLIDWVSNSTYLHWYYYFAIMLFGAFCTKIQRSISYPILKLSFAFFVYFTFKHLVKHFDILLVYQVIVPLGLFPICWYILEVAKKSEYLLPKYFVLNRLIGHVSRLSLDAYIVQFSVIAFYHTQNLPFRLILVFLTVLVAAELLYRCSDFCRKILFKVLSFT